MILPGLRDTRKKWLHHAFQEPGVQEIQGSWAIQWRLREAAPVCTSAVRDRCSGRCAPPLTGFFRGDSLLLISTSSEPVSVAEWRTWGANHREGPSPATMRSNQWGILRLNARGRMRSIRSVVSIYTQASQILTSPCIPNDKAKLTLIFFPIEVRLSEVSVWIIKSPSLGKPSFMWLPSAI